MTDPLPPSDTLAHWLALTTAEFVPVRFPGTERMAFRFCPQTLTVEIQQRGEKYYFPLAVYVPKSAIDISVKA